MPVLDPVPEHVVDRRRRIGWRIREAREAAGVSQERLGELVDLSRNTISNLERGMHSPRLDTLLVISDIVGVPVHELVRVDDASTTGSGPGSRKQ